MKNLFFILLAVAITSISCHKLKDFWDDQLSYKIVKITHDRPRVGDSSWSVGHITYNSHNDPVTAVFDKRFPNYGDPTSWLFKYDTQHRLKEMYRYSGNLPNATYYSHTKYFYNNLGQIIFDSVFHNLNAGTQQNPEWFFVLIERYTYDPQNRITNFERRTEDGSITYDQTYVYDTNGNIQKENFVYDNKINLNSTNKVWQFINRDYSKNNEISAEYNKPTPPIIYNAAGLPTVFNWDIPSHGSGEHTFLEQLYTHSTVAYKVN